MRTVMDYETIKLSVGTYSINLSKEPAGTDTYYLPDSTDQFIDCRKLYPEEKIINYTLFLNNNIKDINTAPIAGFNDGPFPYHIYRLDNGDFLWIRGKKSCDDRLVFCISSDWSNWSLLEDSTKSEGIASFAELSYIFAYSVLNKGGIVFHGAVMEWQGMGIIISAYSGTGKTTHVRMWRDFENALILNGDRALCCKEGDSWYTYGTPWCGTSGEYIRRKVSLKAIVILEQAEVNEIAALTPFEGAKELMRHVFAPYWEEKLINCALNTIDDIVQNIPIFRLRCKPDIEAVALLKNKIS